VITSEFFDVGCSRRVPWPRRPRAAALLERAQGVDRGFDAVVFGENPHLAGGSKETAAKAAQILRSRTAARPAPRAAKTAHR
jgi:hypothetical protein